MGLSVNGVDIDDHVIEREMAHHRHAGNPLKQSVHEVVLRTLLLQEADRLGLPGEDEDDRIEALLASQVRVPQADDADCARYYAANPGQFTSGALVEARHILFQVTPNAPLALLRDTADAVLAALKTEPERFEALARQYSNCPSGAVGAGQGGGERHVPWLAGAPRFVRQRVEIRHVADRLVDAHHRRECAAPARGVAFFLARRMDERQLARGEDEQQPLRLVLGAGGREEVVEVPDLHVKPFK